MDLLRASVLGAFLLGAWAALAPEELGSAEIVVPGFRRSVDDYDERVPAIGLKRVADFAIRPVWVTGDTREADARHDARDQTIRRARQLANPYVAQLSYGEMIVEPLTLPNYKDLPFTNGGRPDTNQ